MRFWALTFAGVAVILAMSYGCAHAQQQPSCGPREPGVARLAEVFGETLHSLGMTTGGNVLEIYVNDETGTWTAIASRPDGVSCEVANGEMWQSDLKPMEKPGKPM